MDDYPLLTDVKFANFLRYKTSTYQTSPRARNKLLTETRHFPEPARVRPLTDVDEYRIWQALAKRKRDETPVTPSNASEKHP